VLKPGQENRYVVNISIETRVTASGDDGLASVLTRESSATVLLRGVAGEKGNVSTEAIIEALTTRATLDGVETPTAEPSEPSPVGQKIAYDLDSQGRAIRSSFPLPAGRAGLAELLFSLARWVPSNDVSVGQSWGQAIAIDSLSGDYGYVAAPGIAEIPKRASVSYKLSSLEGDKAVIDGAIALNQSGSCLLTTKQSRLNVTATGNGKGSTRVEYDLSASRVNSATTETSFEGRLAHIAPTREGEKPQPREGSIVETAKFSIKLVQ
ncbi:MAG TPA: hypothetical protein VN937_08670, partial [Blastocatellia bacterium]|nr:hypothetical protein [Blastocatellia bacterium]